MLVTFSTSAYADTIMFGDIARGLLKMMGHSGSVPGAILAADVPLALCRLKAAIEAKNSLPPVLDKEVKEPVVSMAHRAFPLLKLLSAAEKTQSNVIWK